MPVYLISYDLNDPGQDYERLFNAIKKLSGQWCHPLDSTWLVKKHGGSAASIRDTLRKQMDASDQLLVTQLGGDAAWTDNLGDDADWLKQALS